MVDYDDVPTSMKLRAFIEEFEKGCSNDGHLESDDKKPETCPECVRAFVNACKTICYPRFSNSAV